MNTSSFPGSDDCRVVTGEAIPLDYGVEFMKHMVIRSKMKKGKLLMEDPLISPHVPETDWFRATSLQRMLRRYSTVYIKPDEGRQGNGIIRTRQLNDWESEISHRHTSARCYTNQVMVELKKLLDPDKKYIVQQGIELATFHHRPFDVRVVLQKPLNRWQLSWMSAKVAPRTNSVVTNVAKGATDVDIIKTLQGIDQHVDAFDVQRQLIDVSFQIVQVLGHHFSFNVVGLDMGIDKKGKIWFIEANTKPDFGGLEKLDRRQYQRYLDIKKIISTR